MVKNTSEGTIDSQDRVSDCLFPIGTFTAKVVRADGSIEIKSVRNLVTKNGLNRIANRAIVGATTSVFYVLGIGSYTTGGNPASLGSTNFGELTRKASATQTQSKEFFVLVSTFGGSSDGITSLTIDAGALCDHASSGSGIVGAIGQGLGVTLGNSDFLNLSYSIQIGSHNLAHST
jgi:hypothetical protein